MVKTDRNLLNYILLSIITCGIYPFVFLNGLIKDINVICDGDGNETPGIFKVILLTIVTCGIYAFIFYYKLGNRISENGSRYGLNFSENGTTILVWMIFGILLCGIGPLIAMNILIKNTNALAVAYIAKA
ncbi:MAG: DUF4234 domain-containing protein [Lachnospiraceae bacterium]|nr:DUF4234 domain-containing protein [Lachnospiraceae bacterium]